MMSTSNIHDMLTRTDTIETITRDSGSNEDGGKSEDAIRVWPYWSSRRAAPHVAVALFLSINIVTAAAWTETSVKSGESVTQTFGPILSLFGYLAICYLVGLNIQLFESNTVLFSFRNFGSLGSFFVLVALIPYFFQQVPVSDDVRNAVGLSLLLLLAMKFVLSYLIRYEKILIVGTEHHAQQLYSELVNKQYEPASSPLLRRPKPVIIPGSTIDCRNLPELAIEYGISTIVIAEPDFQNRAGVAEALLDCKVRGLAVENAIACCEKYIRKIWLAGIHPSWLIYTARFKPSRFYLISKRILDLICATSLAILATPILILAAIAIKLDSPGPILFRQMRVGFNGSIFHVWKLRTMRCDAEHLTGPVWAADQDKRITAVGRILRSYRIDEIPQIINVLHGEMSLIGPRPERPNFVEMLKEKINYYALRLCIKPGITGWAQVMQPYGASVGDSYAKLEYDLYYLKHMSLAIDFLILLKTVSVVLSGRGR